MKLRELKSNVDDLLITHCLNEVKQALEDLYNVGSHEPKVMKEIFKLLKAFGALEKSVKDEKSH